MPNRSYQKGKRSEADVKRSVIEVLKARGILSFRMNAGDQIIIQGKNRRRIMGNLKGTADILAFVGEGYSCNISSHPLWIETKSSGGRQTHEQEQFQELVEHEGHTYLLVRSAAEVNDWLEANT